MIKKIEDKILEILSKNSSIKVIAQPIIDFSGVRQNVIVNVRYDSEKFIIPNEKKAMLGSTLPTKKRISDINFKLEIFYKDLRGGYDLVYSTFDNLVKSLHGEIIDIPEENYNFSPFHIDNISFVEKNSNSFIKYECNLTLRVGGI